MTGTCYFPRQASRQCAPSSMERPTLSADTNCATNPELGSLHTTSRDVCAPQLQPHELVCQPAIREQVARVPASDQRVGKLCNRRKPVPPRGLRTQGCVLTASAVQPAPFLRTAAMLRDVDASPCPLPQAANGPAALQAPGPRSLAPRPLMSSCPEPCLYHAPRSYERTGVVYADYVSRVSFAALAAAQWRLLY